VGGGRLPLGGEGGFDAGGVPAEGA
jgi:hypothetical protein